MAAVTLHPQSTALLLQDMQNDLLKGPRPVAPLSGAALIANCQRLRAKACDADYDCVVVRDGCAAATT